MKNLKKIIIFALALAVILGAGFYFKKNASVLLNSAFSQANGELKKLNQIDIGAVIKEVGKEIILPPPLQVVAEKKASATIAKSGVILETNAQRQTNGLPALTENAALSNAALAKANDILKNQYFDHVSPSGTSPSELVQSYGYSYITTGENLILGSFTSAKEVVQKWMDSPGHRANILNNRYTEIGVAVVKGTYKGDTVWVGVQEFGRPMASCKEPDVALKNKIETFKIQLDAMASQIEQARQQINGANQVEAYNQIVNDYNLAAQQTKQFVSEYNEQINTFNSCVSGQ